MSSPAAVRPGRRKRLGRVLTETHYRLRTEGDTPGRKAVAIFVGTVVGCTPLYGIHFFICVGLARWLGVSRMTTYLAAHVNNPLTAPALVYGGYGIGHLIFQGTWPALSLGQLGSVSLWSAGRDLMVGSLILGVVLGTALGLVSYAIGVRWQRSSVTMQLWEETSRLYLDSGIFHWEFVHAKLKHDPLYAGLLASGTLPGSGTLLDLGCGRGIVMAMLQTARSFHEGGTWEEGWPAPPSDLSATGVEHRESIAEVGRAALGPAATIETADLRTYEPAPCDAVLLFDVLHYLTRDEQARLLERASRALRPGGVILLREADAGAGLRFFATRAGERICALARRQWKQRFAYRSSDEWCELMRAQGLETDASAMSEGTPFGNVMIVGRK